MLTNVDTILEVSADQMRIVLITRAVTRARVKTDILKIRKETVNEKMVRSH